MQCVVVTPEKTIIDSVVEFVVLPLYDGEYGVASGHTPVIGRLGAGELRLTKPDQTVETWYIEGGFAEVLDDAVSLLTNRAYPVDKLDPEEARMSFETISKKKAASEEEQIAKDLALKAARTKIRIAEKFAKK